MSDFKLLLQFEDGSWRAIDLANKLHGKIFEPLKDIEYFKTVKVNHDIDTIVWDNEADISPDYLFEMSVPAERVSSVRQHASPSHLGPALGRSSSHTT